MQPITVFYHLYIPPKDQYYLFPLWINEQLGSIEKSGLSKYAQVKIGLTMPAYYQVFNMNRSYYDVVTSYIREHFPFAEVIDIRDTGQDNIYEGQTLQHAWNHAHNNDGLVFYFHSKGISTAGNPTVHDWRQLMQYFLVTQWETCVEMLDTHDVVSLKSQWLGNFWWATCKYLRSLPNPLDSGKYVFHDPEMMPGLKNYRLAFEIWILANSPRIHYMHESTVNHYQTFYPPRLYIQDKNT